MNRTNKLIGLFAVLALLLNSFPAEAKFARVGALSLAEEEEFPRGFVIDEVHGFMYFAAGTPESGSKIIKISLPDFKRVDEIRLPPNLYRPLCAIIDSAREYAYFGVGFNSTVIKLRLSDFTIVGDLPIGVPVDMALLDDVHGYAYFVHSASTFFDFPSISKVRLSDFTLEKKVIFPLNANVKFFESATIDPKNGYAYIGTLGISRILKIRLSDLELEDQIIFDKPGDDRLQTLSAAIIDAKREFVYFGAYGGSVVKVRLSDFSRVADIPVAYSIGGGALLDPVGNFAYFVDYAPSTEFTTPFVARVSLESFKVTEKIFFPIGEGFVKEGAIDISKGIAYFGTHGLNNNTITGTKIVKVDVSRPYFRRGDLDGDGRLTIVDPIRILQYAFQGGEAPACLDVADVNADRKVDLTDAVHLLTYLFAGGKPVSDKILNCISKGEGGGGGGDIVTDKTVTREQMNALRALPGGNNLAQMIPDPAGDIPADVDGGQVKLVNNVLNSKDSSEVSIYLNPISSGRVILKLFTLNGDFVKTIWDQDQPAGPSNVTWKGDNEQNEKVASGIYLLYAEGPGFKTKKKIAVVR